MKVETITQVKSLISRSCKLAQTDMTSANRMPYYALARMIGYYIAREYTASTYEDIGKEFQKHHATIMHGATRVHGLLVQYPAFYSQLLEIVNTGVPTDLSTHLNKIIKETPMAKGRNAVKEVKKPKAAVKKAASKPTAIKVAIKKTKKK